MTIRILLQQRIWKRKRKKYLLDEEESAITKNQPAWVLQDHNA
jgi:hypothetical protein